MQYSTGAAAAPSVKPSTNAVQEINQRLAALQESFGKNAERMDRIIDRAFGSAKQDGASGGNPRAVPNGEIGALMERLDDLGALADRQSDIIGRLDTIV